MTQVLPRYPIYVISKGRAKACLTARFLIKDQVPFKLVIEPQEHQEYCNAGYAAYITMLPFSNLGLGSIPARNWVWEHAKASGAARHWILDDNIRIVYRKVGEKRIPCASGPAFAAVEDFVDRYTNVAIGGMNYKMFGVMPNMPPFYHNTHVYSCMLIKNDLPHRWRGRYNEDTDLCLQVLTDGWCTVLVNVFLADKIATMRMKGGNMDELYKGDGRLKMARSLERQWPGVVTTQRRYQRPQHVVHDSWKKFDTPLKRRSDVDFDKLKQPNEYGLELTKVREIKNERTQQFFEEQTGKK